MLMDSRDHNDQESRRYLRFRIGKTPLAIPLKKVWMILHGERIEGVSGAPRSMKGKIPFYAGATPVLDPEQKLPVDASDSDTLGNCVLMMEYKQEGSKNKDHFFGLPVDQVIGIDEICIKDISPNLPSLSGQDWGNPVGTAEVNRETIHIVDPEKLITSKDMKLFLEACQ